MLRAPGTDWMGLRSFSSRQQPCSAIINWPILASLGILAMQARKVSSRFQLLCLPRWSHRHQGQLLPAAGLELVRLPVRDNPLAIFQKSRLSAASREVSCAGPPLMNFKANMDVRL